MLDSKRIHRSFIFVILSLAAAMPVHSDQFFIRGDTNLDGDLDLADAVATLESLFVIQQTTCVESQDSNDDGAVNIADAIFVLDYLFAGGAAPPPPWPDCGADPTPDSIGCDQNSNCAILQPLSDLEYTENTAIYRPGLPITPNMPSFSSGIADSFSIEPPLPLGLDLDPSTGVISGIPVLQQLAETYTVSASNSLNSVSKEISIRVSLSFVLDASEVLVPYDPANGTATTSVSVTLEEIPSGNPAAFTPIEGWSLGIRVEPTELVIDAALEGVDSVLLNGGSGADFYIASLYPDGMNVAVVASFPFTDWLIADTPKEIVSLQVSAAPGFLQGNFVGAVAALTFDATIGIPPMALLVVSPGPGSEPTFENGSIEFTP